MKYCPNCGKAVGENDNFCTHCGKRIKFSSTIVKQPTNGAQAAAKPYYVRQRTNEPSESQLQASAPAKALNYFDWLRASLKNCKGIYQTKEYFGLISVFIIGLLWGLMNSLAVVVYNIIPPDPDEWGGVFSKAFGFAVVICILLFIAVGIAWLIKNSLHKTKVGYLPFMNEVMQKCAYLIVGLLVTVIVFWITLYAASPENISWDQTMPQYYVKQFAELAQLLIPGYLIAALIWASAEDSDFK